MVLVKRYCKHIDNAIIYDLLFLLQIMRIIHNYDIFIVAFLENATIEYSSESRCVCVSVFACVCACVCVCVCMITQKYLSRNMKLEYFVVYEKITRMSLILSRPLTTRYSSPMLRRHDIRRISDLISGNVHKKSYVMTFFLR